MGMDFDGRVFYGHPFDEEEVSGVSDGEYSLDEIYFDIIVPSENYDYDYVDDPDGPYSYSYKVTNKEEQQRYYADRKAARDDIAPVQFGYSGYLGGEMNEYLCVQQYTSDWGAFERLNSLPVIRGQHHDVMRRVVETLGLEFDESRVGWYLTATYSH